MAGAGFEPAKAEPIGLQPIPFDRFGTPPSGTQHSGRRYSPGGSPRPGSTSNWAYFGPPSSTLAPPPTAAAGTNQRCPSPVNTKSQSQRFELKRLTTPFQLRFPPLVQIATTQRPFRLQVVVFTCTRSNSASWS